MAVSPTLTTDFDYSLPSELIAQDPCSRRDAARLMVVRRNAPTLEHRSFADISSYLEPGDVLVLNRSRVIRARLNAQRPTGGMVELLFLRPLGTDRWLAMARPSRKLATGMILAFPSTGFSGVVLERWNDGQWLIQIDGPGEVADLFACAGSLPLPPYIRSSSAPEDRYQTVYADRDGSIAAPTAGLHFTPDLLDTLGRCGVELQFVTLHVGAGTFKPVTVDRVDRHVMHPEWGEVPETVAEAANRARREGHRVVAVGTTTTRLLETAWCEGRVQAWTGMTERFIYPGYRFEAIDGLVTNFHLPRSTLLMLVSALAGRERILAAYREAVARRYRFFSFGDAMLIL